MWRWRKNGFRRGYARPSGGRLCMCALSGYRLPPGIDSAQVQVVSNVEGNLCRHPFVLLLACVIWQCIITLNDIPMCAVRASTMGTALTHNSIHIRRISSPRCFLYDFDGIELHPGNKIQDCWHEICYALDFLTTEKGCEIDQSAVNRVVKMFGMI